MIGIPVRLPAGVESACGCFEGPPLPVPVQAMSLQLLDAHSNMLDAVPRIHHLSSHQPVAECVPAAAL